MDTSEELTKRKRNGILSRETFMIRGGNTWVRKNDNEYLLRIENDILGVQTIVDAHIIDKLKEFKYHAVVQKNLNNPVAPAYTSIEGGRTGKLSHHVMLLKDGRNLFKAMKEIRWSVDHKNRNPLDNRTKNLRWADAAMQNKNRKRATRKYTAQPLPEDVTQAMLPKYVYYARIKTLNGHNDLFRIANHPKLDEDEVWQSSCSKKFTNKEKLDMVYYKLKELDPSSPFECTGKSREEYIAEMKGKKKCAKI